MAEPGAQQKSRRTKPVKNPKTVKAPKKVRPRKSKKKASPRILPTTPTDLIDFSFDNSDLTEAVSRFAEKKKVNIILPQQAAAIKQKITFKPGHLLTLDEAEKYLYLFLDYAGYTPAPGEDFSIIIKNKEAISNPLPLYVFDTESALLPEDLPDNNAYIRVVYYLANLKVDDQATNPVVVILKEILSGLTNVFVDPVSNAIVISDKARVIISALQLLKELDSVSSKHTLVTLQLYNANARYVTDLLNTQILAVGNRMQMPGTNKSSTIGSYFSTNMRVVADERRNTLILMGKEAPVNRLKDFVREYMDAPLDSGQSVFHVYDLKYLDAQSFADVLTNVVTSSGFGDQKTAERTSGARRFFEGVVIRAETYRPAEAPQSQGAGAGNEFDQGATGGTVYKGGNRLLVAAQPADWEQLKKLIDQLDIPQRQVILEVLIVDYERDILKALQSQVRNLDRMDFVTGAAFQAANINSNILVSPGCTVPTAVQAAAQNTGDLLQKASNDFFKAAGGLNDAAKASAATQAAAIGQAAQAATTLQNGLTGAANATAGVAQLPTCPANATIATDLLQILSGNTIIPASPGTFAISFNDFNNSGIWGVLALLDQIGHAKVLSHPYLIALNNTNSQVYSSVIKRTDTDGSSSSGGAIQVNIGDIPAVLSMSLTPRISSEDRLNLEIVVQIEQFTTATGFTRNSRKVVTNVNLQGASEHGPGQVLVLGGLTQTVKTQTATETPILGRIPIIGWFFRGDTESTTETELGIFIRPTIIDPRRRANMSEYTRRKIRGGTRPVDESFLGNRKDPIVRFFFGTDSPERSIIEDYMRETRIVPAEDIAKAPRPAPHSRTFEPLEEFESSLLEGKIASPQASTQEALDLGLEPASLQN